MLAKRALEDCRGAPIAPQGTASILKLVVLVLNGKSVDFSKVISMIKEMGTLLHPELGDDDTWRAYCLENLNRTEYDVKAIARTITVVKDDTRELQDRLYETVSGIAVVQKSVVELDASVAKATEIRQKQHAEFVALTTPNAGATEVEEILHAQVGQGRAEG